MHQDKEEKESVVKKTIATLAALLMLCTQGFANDIRSVKIIAGGPAGTATDLYARLLAPHLSAHLPGRPAIVVENMTGAAGRIAAAFLIKQAPKDGSVIGSLPMPSVMAPLYDAVSPGYDSRSLVALGSADSGTRVCATTARSGVRSFAEVRRREVTVGADGYGSARDMYARMLNRLAGGKFKIVLGYRGSSEVFLAMERGEIDGMCGMEWTSLSAQRPAWVKNGSVSFILQTGPARVPLAGFGPVADMRDYMNARDTEVAEFIVAELALSRFFAVAAGVPRERLVLLRRAFEAAMRDPALLTEAKKRNLTTRLVRSTDAERILKSILEVSPRVLAQAKWAVSRD
ncbi:hypothetical protein A2763_03840 [Candidatus Kaiserbacteria bacterium RIFCSPHIGHO2_01_FULL_54_36]|uniref:PBP domain-containing protein n=1 Tax=Candidatus Kaiserbacteria bacterium RIFCSPHIGHO2_01_FULL_54_36 TaxID=1798482 RepID=A0A1F6CJM3_9BACT|nr:MAG: hypothetical protein A2763_03840 [Candidatus Kaiserbacteria bacterium RIFCSPHIGHO2_01_FULL_54_36]OGG75612.1 MAG: hypothetical protein A3A41_00650 [Candidatus Kaiserbacteria bacterium RIFCSPLOWO2_01_FULL_54_22]